MELNDCVIHKSMNESGSCFDNAKLRAVSTTFWVFSPLSISTGSHAELVGCRFMKPVTLPGEDNAADQRELTFEEEYEKEDYSANIGLFVEAGSDAIVRESTFEGLRTAIFVQGLKSVATAEGSKFELRGVEAILYISYRHFLKICFELL